MEVHIQVQYMHHMMITWATMVRKSLLVAKLRAKNCQWGARILPSKWSNQSCKPVEKSWPIHVYEIIAIKQPLQSIDKNSNLLWHISKCPPLGSTCKHPIIEANPAKSIPGGGRQYSSGGRQYSSGGRQHSFGEGCHSDVYAMHSTQQLYGCSVHSACHTITAYIGCLAWTV